MNINFDSNYKVFTLEGKNFLYIFYINYLGIPVKLYFGKKIFLNGIDERFFNHVNNLNADSYNYFDFATKKEVINNEQYFSGLTSDLEAPSFSTYDKRGALVEIKHDDGSYVTDFRYVNYEIYEGKKELENLPHFDSQKCLTLEVLLKDIKCDIYLKMFYTVYEDLDIIVRHNEIINNSDKTVYLNKAYSLCLDMSDLDYELLSVYGTYATDRILERQKLRHNLVSITENAGGKGFYHNPVCMLLRSDTTYNCGEAIGFGLVYSSNFRFDFIGNPLNKLRCLIGINSENFALTLNKNDKFVTPEAFFIYANKGINSLTHGYHDVIRNHLLKKNPYEKKPILLNSWEGCMMDFDTEKILKFIKKSKQMGVNLFVLDDGWFGKRNDDTSSLGDWEVNIKKIDLKRVIDYAHSLKMKFGLWIEPEMVSFDSKLYREHPDYALYDETINPTSLRHQFVLDITREDVREFIFDKIKNIFDNYDIDYCKWDFNRIITEAHSQKNIQANNQIYHAFITGTYDLLNKFTKRYPKILLETCAGGGGRFDLGMLYYSPQIWGSDETDGVARTLIQYATNIFYPLSCIGSHVSARKFLSIKEKAAIALFGTFGYELDPTKLNNEDLEEVKISNLWFKKYKKLIDEGDYYSLISPYNNNFVAREVVSKNKNEAIIFYMNYRQVNWESRFLKIQGLKEDYIYKNDLSNDCFSGSVYMNIGLNMSSGRQSFTPSLIYLKRIKNV